MIATATDPARARPRRGRARSRRDGRHRQRRRRAAAHPHRAPGRSANRRARPVRQPAPAPHGLQAAQHGAARRGRAQGPARLRVRRARRRHRRDPPLCRSEAEVYRLLGLEYIEPELRENRGELEAAAERDAARADRASTICSGDLHCHTAASDGTASIEEMARRRARRRLRVSGDHRPLRELRLRRRPLARPARASTSSGSARPRSTGSSCSPAARSTSSRTARSTTTTTCSPSSTG